MKAQDPKTLTVAEAGARYFGLCRASSYAAAARGDLPVIRIGKLMRVPIAALERMMLEAGKEPAEARK
jgi:excisionase family DNA binding protein